MAFFRRLKNKRISAFSFTQDLVALAVVERVNGAKPKLIHWENIAYNAENLPRVLKETVKTHRLQKTTLTFSLSSDAYRLLVVDSPPVPEEELVSAVKWEVQDIIDTRVEETTFDIFSVPQDSNLLKSINVVAAKKAEIVEKVELFRQAKVTPSIIDIEELALRNLVCTVKDDSNGIIAVMMLDHYGVVVFCKNKQLYFSRRLELGLDDLDKSQSNLESLALEIQRSIDYFDRHFTAINMAGVTVLPSFGVCHHVAKYLDKNLSMSCDVADLNQDIEWCAEPVSTASHNVLIALGTALREQGEIK